jgi:DNA-binding Xre family transcriptional regulator
MTPRQINVYSTTVAAQIEAMKNKNKVTSGELAKTLNMSVEEYGTLEKYGDFNLGQLRAVCERLNVSLTDFISMNEKMYNLLK